MPTPIGSLVSHSLKITTTMLAGSYHYSYKADEIIG